MFDGNGVTGAVLAVGYYALFLGSGMYIGRKLLCKERYSIVMQYLVGSVAGVLALQWFPLLFAFAFDFSMTAHVLALLLQIVLCVLVGWRCHCSESSLQQHPYRKVNEWKRLFRENPVWILMAVTFVFFCYCLYTHTIVGNADGSMHTGQSTYGDMNMHFSFITSIANQQTFPPEYSLLPGHKLSYPFLCDSVSSSLYLMGASLRLAYVLPMLGVILQVFVGFYCLIKYWLGRSATALIAWILFFWNGGLGFVYFDNAEKIHKIFTEFYMTPTNYLDKNLRWVQVMVDMLIPQRATLFGWSILFPLLAFLFRAIAERKKKLFVMAGVAAGALPMIHTHSFLALGMICAVWLLLDLTENSLFESERIALGRKASASRGSGRRNGKATSSGRRNSKATSSGRRNGKVTSSGRRSANVSASTGNRIGSSSADATATVSDSWIRYALYIGLAFFSVMQMINRSNEFADKHGLAIMIIGVVVFVLFLGYKLVRYLQNRLWKRLAFTWGIFLILVLIFALPQLFMWTFSQASGDNFVRSHFNWSNNGDQYIVFYLKNLGLPFVLLLLSSFVVSVRNLKIGAPYLLIWFVAELAAFQPNDYDNNKLLFVGAVFICGLAADALVQLYERYGAVYWRSAIGKTGVVLLGACLLFVSAISGFLTMGREWVSDYELYTASAVKACRYIEDETTPWDVILTSTAHNSPVPALTGRSIVCGSSSFLYYHGLNYQQNEQDVETMYTSPAGAKELFRKYDVNYIYLSNQEYGTYNVDVNGLYEVADVVWQKDDVSVWKVKDEIFE